MTWEERDELQAFVDKVERWKENLTDEDIQRILLILMEERLADFDRRMSW